MEDGSIETKANWYLKNTQTVNGMPVEVWDRYDVPVGTYYTNYGKNATAATLALQLALTKKFSDKWMADASFMYQDWKQFNDPNEVLNMTNYDYFNGAPYYSHSLRGAADTYVNSRWQFKFSGLYQLPWGINVSALFSLQEGYIIGDYIQSTKKLKGGTYQYLYDPTKKFGENRLPAFWTLNMGVEKKFMIGANGRTSVTVFVDAYNLTNNDTILAKGAQIGTASYNLITNQLNPGLFQIGVRFHY